MTVGYPTRGGTKRVCHDQLMARHTVNPASVTRAHALIDSKQYVLDSD
ncbi:hypothetical protein [Aldersonia kunmingensis]|nr:hypothetical protein [Aldersonia kunmingensis]